jgi:transcriptional regulator with GAF, ATPase, and Fis domain
MMQKRSILKQHLHDEEARLLSEALEANQWIMLRAAKALNMTFSSFQRALARHPEIAAKYRARNASLGRPPKTQKKK